MVTINKEMMLEALKRLDQKLSFAVYLVMGGGGAMVLAHDFPVGTYDIDAVPIKTDFSQIDSFVKEVGAELGISPDWLNPYFATFAHTLPEDYAARLIPVFKGAHLSVDALGREEMLILKIFAGRQKDISHAKLLIKKGADIAFVEKHLEKLRKKRIPGVGRAADFLDDVMDTV